MINDDYRKNILQQTLAGLSQVRDFIDGLEKVMNTEAITDKDVLIIHLTSLTVLEIYHFVTEELSERVNEKFMVINKADPSVNPEELSNFLYGAKKSNEQQTN